MLSASLQKTALSALVMAVFSYVAPAVSAAPKPLRYKTPSEQVYYNVTITVDTPTEISTYQGRISYEALNRKSDDVWLKFRGGLKKSAKAKGSSRSPRGGPPRGFRGPSRSGPPRPGFPFGPTSRTTALQQTTSDIAMTPTGDILSLTGESQIPVPLGHLSILVFDSLPDESKESWSTENGVVLGRKEESDRGFPRRPFDPRAKPGKTSAGSESASYSVKSTEGSRVNIDKKYNLTSPNSDTPFTFGGAGSLVFDSDIGMFAAADLKYELKLSSKNVDIKIPVSIKYTLLSKEEVAEADRKKREVADAALQKGMAAAQASFAKHSDEQIAEIYRKGGLVPPTGRIITPEMKVPVGLIAQNKWPTAYKWSATRIVKILPGNLIRIQSLESKRFYVRNRNTLSLAPDFVDQPGVSEADLAEFRKQLAAAADK